MTIHTDDLVRCAVVSKDEPAAVRCPFVSRCGPRRRDHAITSLARNVPNQPSRLADRGSLPHTLDAAAVRRGQPVPFKKGGRSPNLPSHEQGVTTRVGSIPDHL